MDWQGFDPQPTLVGETVRLLPMTAGDWDGMFAAAGDPQIWAEHPAHDRWREPVFRCFFDEGLASGGALTIHDSADDTIIGSSRYDRSRVEPDEVEIGWTFLARSHWGGPTNRAVKQLMIGHALVRFRSAVFYVGETNGRSRRAMEKIGGVLVADRRIEFDMAGVPTSHVVYAIAEPLR